MIKVLIKKKENQIINFKITGHANSDVYGKDLVCAGVSTSSIGTLNMLVKKGFLYDHIGTIEVNEGYINIIVKQVDEICQVVLETLETTLDTMAEDYGQFIEISKVEV